METLRKSPLNDTAYRKAYNSGEELLPDYVYDAAFGSEETDLDDNAGAGELVEHLHPMLSLPTYFVDIDTLNVAKLQELGYNRAKDATVSWKVDGVAVSMIVDGTSKQLLRMVSRGKRFAGFVLNKAWHSIMPPINVAALADGTVFDFRGELYISKKNFERINATLLKPYASPRAMVAGNINALEPNMDIVNACTILLHGIWINNMSAMHCTKLTEYFDRTNIAPFYVLNANADDESIMHTIQGMYEQAMHNDTPCDGIVIQVAETCDNDGRANLDRIALKQLDEAKYSATTTVHHIEWRLKNNGSYFPRIWYKPVDINGSTVTHTAGYCWDYIKQLGLSIGAEVQITMRGGVIPYVTKVVSAGNGDYELPADIQDIEPNDIHIWSTKSQQAVERLRFIRGMEMLSLDNCGTELFCALYDAGYHTLFDIAEEVKQGTFASHPLAKGALPDTLYSQTKLLAIIDRFKTFNYVWLIMALREPGIGFKAANAIGQHLSGYTLRDPRPLNTKAVQAFLSNMDLVLKVQHYANAVLVEHADLAVHTEPIQASQASNRLKVCMSKKPSNGMKKAEFAATYLSAYDITENIKEADLLVCPAGEVSNKINFANANNIAIKYYEDFI